MSSAVIDIVLISLFLIAILVGVKNGIVRSVLGIFAVAFSLLFSSMLTSNSADAIYDNIAKAPIEYAIEQRFGENENIEISEEIVDEVVKSLPEEIVQGAESFGVDINKIAQQVSGMKLSSENASKELAQNVARPIAVAVIQALTFTVLFLIINVILQIIITIVCGLIKIPILKNFDKVFGGVFGFVKGSIIIAFAALFLSTIAALTAQSDFAIAVEKSRIVDFIMSTGIFSKLALI